MKRFSLIAVDVLAFFAGAILALFAAPFVLALAAGQPKGYRYTYQAHPFDDPQNFWIDAGNQDEADALAKQKFAKMFENGQTVMTEFRAN